MLYYSLFLQTKAPSSDPMGGFGGPLTLLLLFVVMYFFMIRPQQRKQKEQNNFRNTLKKGDRIVTIGGLHGKITDMNDSTITLEVDRGIKLIFERTAISMEASRKLLAGTASNEAPKTELSLEKES